jgi:protein phosphatase
MLASMVQRGLLSQADLATHPMRNVLTQSAGSQEEVDVHVLEEDTRAGDTLLLCSDGLYGVVADSAIASILSTEETIEGASRRLIDSAIAAGAPDNVSVVLVRHC